MTRNEYSKCLTRLMNELEQIEAAIRDIQNDHDVFELQGNMKSDYVSLLKKSNDLTYERCKLSLKVVSYDVAC